MDEDSDDANDGDGRDEIANELFHGSDVSSGISYYLKLYILGFEVSSLLLFNI